MIPLDSVGSSLRDMEGTFASARIAQNLFRIPHLVLAFACHCFGSQLLEKVTFRSVAVAVVTWQTAT